jgi:outer membrane protein OmpA-like peptidoglycan-associated protein
MNVLLIDRAAPGALRLSTLAVALLALNACTTPVKPDGADTVQQQLVQLQTDPRLAGYAPSAFQDAALAVQAANTVTADKAAGEQAVYVAQRKVQIARAEAERQLAEEEARNLVLQRSQIQLDARTREAQIATAQAAVANAAALQQQQAAQAALAQAAALRQQMDELQAQNTDRGMVMTLGDVLFSTGKADLKPGAIDRLAKLAAFLIQYPNRSVTIEGHTDSTGSDAINQALSQSRAESVKAYLISQSIDAGRISAVGKGKESPIADNTTAAGRQQNRRVEIIISDPLTPGR